MPREALISGGNGGTRVLGTVEITTLWYCLTMIGERYSIIIDEDFFPSTYIKLRSQSIELADLERGNRWC